MTKAPLDMPEEDREAGAAGPGSLHSHPFAALRRQVDRLLEEFERGTGGASATADSPPALLALTSSLQPAMDVVEQENAYKVSVDLPGFDASNIEVGIRGNFLVIAGERKAEKEKKGKEYHLSERISGSFERRVNLPADVDPVAVSASLKNGVLRILLPRRSGPQGASRKIDVKSGD